jgi:predicted transposase/invertase (TIGR01784 family)
MLGIKLEETRVYREAKEEGRLEGKQEAKLELVPAMLARGMSVEEVCELLGLTEEQVNQSAGNES